MEAVIYTGE